MARRSSRWRRGASWLAALAASIAALLAWSGYFNADAISIYPAGTRHGSNLAAVYLSSDVGLRLGAGQPTIAALTSRGIPVVAINSLTFFRRHRQRAEIAALLDRAIARAQALAPGRHVVVIGHSLGADAAQVGLAGLSPARREAVRGAVLIVPTRALYFEVSLREMLEWGRPDEAAMDTLRDLTWLPLTCISGRDEAASPCGEFGGPRVRHVVLPGGHLLRFDNAAINAAVVQAIGASISLR